MRYPPGGHAQPAPGGYPGSGGGVPAKFRYDLWFHWLQLGAQPLPPTGSVEPAVAISVLTRVFIIDICLFMGAF